MHTLFKRVTNQAETMKETLNILMQINYLTLLFFIILFIYEHVCCSTVTPPTTVFALLSTKCDRPVKCLFIHETAVLSQNKYEISFFICSFGETKIYS